MFVCSICQDYAVVTVTLDLSVLKLQDFLHVQRGDKGVLIIRVSLRLSLMDALSQQYFHDGWKVLDQ